MALVAGLAVGCTNLDPAEEESTATTIPLPEQAVTVPPERQSTFCVAMVELTDDIRAGELDDVDAAILATYRDVEPDVPELIAGDFALVLDALERGLPPPTDPPRSTVVTTPPSSIAAPTTTTTTVPSATSVPAETAAPTDADLGYAPGESPSERVNSYIEFVCRANANNPGPPATAPGEPTT